MPLIKIHNVATGEIIERELNAEELLQLKKDEAEEKARKDAAELIASKKAAAEAKLAALGLTADDLKALGLA